MKTRLFTLRNLAPYAMMLFGSSGLAQINSAEQLIKGHLEALGGYEAWKAITSITSISLYEEGMHKQIHRLDRKRPNLIRITTNYDVETGTFGYCEGFDGAAWEYSFKIPVRVIGEPARALKNASVFEKPYIDYDMKGYEANLLGKVLIKDYEVYHLILTTDGRDTLNFFFDVKTLMESISIGNAPFHGEGASIEIFEKRSDYRPVHGVMIPFLTEQWNEDQLLSRITQQVVEVNTEIADDWFSPPLSQEELMYTNFRNSVLEKGIVNMPMSYRSYYDFALERHLQKLENQLNTFGYELISYQRYDDAIAVFKMAIEHRPESGNLHDSLGETYLLTGDTTNAVAYYRKSLELDPGNQYGREVLNKLTGEK